MAALLTDRPSPSAALDTHPSKVQVAKVDPLTHSFGETRSVADLDEDYLIDGYNGPYAKYCLGQSTNDTQWIAIESKLTTGISLIYVIDVVNAKLLLTVPLGVCSTIGSLVLTNGFLYVGVRPATGHAPASLLKCFQLEESSSYPRTFLFFLFLWPTVFLFLSLSPYSLFFAVRLGQLLPPLEIDSSSLFSPLEFTAYGSEVVCFKRTAEIQLKACNVLTKEKEDLPSFLTRCNGMELSSSYFTEVTATRVSIYKKPSAIAGWKRLQILQIIDQKCQTVRTLDCRMMFFLDSTCCLLYSSMVCKD